MQNGYSDTLEQLLMPGLLTRAHAEFQADCDQCHESFRKADQTRLCLACHDHADIASDIRRREGFHGRMRDAKRRECRSCHAEHLGRDTDIVLLDADNFDHRPTDFPLRGAHRVVACASCHETGKKYRDAPRSCVDCHEADDAHRGRLGKKCRDCHGESGWRKARFDHDKDTKFPLVGKHRQVGCKLCHASERYKDTPKTCLSCHRLNDSHRGRFGGRCETCHAPEKWTKIILDHDRDTDFPLVGRHREAHCLGCHTGRLDQHKKERGRCFACHREDDEHRGRNGKDCAGCHTPKSWAGIRFDHDKDTRFPLLGKHAEQDCVFCHRGEVKDEKLDTGCYACHRGDDPHDGQEGRQCADCHNEAGWSERVFFEHDLTAFPLIGMHAVAPCEACHSTQAFKDAASGCDECHADDDVHKSTLGTDCARCHNPNGWRLWLFDHARDTGFELDGAHAELRCGDCHRSQTEAARLNASGTCGSCHRVDDPHRGRFGARCAHCHDTTTFGAPRLP